MSQVIIYRSRSEESGVVVLVPSPEALSLHSIYDIAVKDVPEGIPFAVVDDTDLPSQPQEAWEVDLADLNDGVGGQSNEFN
jgi:hypothetical protein